MNIEDPRWEAYENRFRSLAENVDLQKGPQPELASAQLLLCLYGDNALTPDQEFEALDRLAQALPQLKGTEMQTAYWEDIVLYLP